MRGHQRSAVTTAVISAALLAASCSGGGAEADAEPESAPTSQEAPTGPPPQPEGADGVTWEIQNWDEVFEDPAVLTWKQFNEALAASIQQGELLPDARELSTRDALQPYLDSFEYARSNDFTVKDLTYARIEESRLEGASATITACTWRPSSVLYDQDGEPVSELDESWSRQIVALADDGGWMIEDVEFDGECDGEDPS
jgi:hypothetical protein